MICQKCQSKLNKNRNDSKYQMVQQQQQTIGLSSTIPNVLAIAFAFEPEYGRKIYAEKLKRTI